PRPLLHGAEHRAVRPARRRGHRHRAAHPRRLPVPAAPHRAGHLHHRAEVAPRPRTPPRPARRTTARSPLVPDPLTLPVAPGFLWGASTAAHQIEGGNVNSDWWAKEHVPGSLCAESSGDAVDSYHRYPEDIRLLADA